MFLSDWLRQLHLMLITNKELTAEDPQTTTTTTTTTTPFFEKHLRPY